MAVTMIAIPACRSTLHTTPVGYAEPVEDWNGFGNLARDGKVFFGGQPTRKGLSEAASRGIRIVVNLRTEEEMSNSVELDEKALVQSLGMEYVPIPITARTLSAANADQLRDVLGDKLGPVLIHCGAANRVGALWALYLHRHRALSLDEAIERGRAAGLRSDELINAIRRAAEEPGG